MKAVKVLSAFLLVSLCLSAQQGDSLRNVDRLFSSIQRLQEKQAVRFAREQEKILLKLQQQEVKIVKKLRGFDSLKAKLLASDVEAKYQASQMQLTQPLDKVKKNVPYISRIDSLQTLLKFLGSRKGKQQQVEKALSSIGDLQSRLGQSMEIQRFIDERQQALKSLLSIDALSNTIGKDLSKSIVRYSRQAYYYKQKVADYKETLSHPESIEKEALQIVGKLPAFKRFMQQNSQLAQLFGPGVTEGSTANADILAGLQTRSSVTQLLKQQLGQTDINPQQFVQQQLDVSRSELSKIKDKLASARNGGNGEADMAEFKPNTQKGKPFLKRLEYGFNIQTSNKGAYDFPAINDITLTVGFKMHDRLIAGFGLAYKLGLGKDWKNISFTHEGVGLRSYIDWKLSALDKGVKALFGNLWLSGGYEQNYMSRFRYISSLRQVAWQTSGLIGISRKIQYKKKQLKVSVLWDFLNKQQPDGQPFVFRYGYNF